MFFRKKIFKSPEQKEAEALPRTKKVQYCAEDINEITERLNADLESILRLQSESYVPVWLLRPFEPPYRVHNGKRVSTLAIHPPENVQYRFSPHTIH